MDANCGASALVGALLGNVGVRARVWPGFAIVECAVRASRRGYSTTYRRFDNSPILGVKLKGEWHGVRRSAHDARADS